MKFEVQKSPLLVCLMLLLVALTAFAGYTFFFEGKSFTSGFSLTICFVASFLWVVAFFRSYFVIEEKDLILVFGVNTKRIPLQSIREVKRTNNPAATTAWTLKRLEVKYNRYDEMLISLPKEEERFLAELKKRNENISIC